MIAPRNLKILCLEISLILLFGLGFLWGQEEIKVPGELILYDAVEKYKRFDIVITITAKGIKIVSDKSIFQSFNDFDTPRSNKLFMGMRELRKITLNENQVSLYTYSLFYKRYQNYFLDIEYGIFAPYRDKVLVFNIDENAAFDTQVFKRLVRPVELKIYQPFKTKVKAV